MNHFQNTIQKSILHFRVKLFFVVLISNFSDLSADAPDWSVNAADYSSNLSLVSEFYLNEEVFDVENIVGAFVGEECRGVSTVAAYGDGYVYLITIYSNTVGETVNFKAWVADEDAVVDVEESITYAPGVIGTLSSPEQFTAFQNFDFSPSLSGIPDQTIHMGDDFTTITLGDYLTVEDSDELLWTTSSSSHFTISISDDVITLTPEADWIGSESIIFTVTELTENGYSDSDTAIYTQLRSDDPPAIVGLPDQVIGTNATFLSFDLDDYIIEVDDDPLIYEYDYGDPVDTHDDPGWIVIPSDFEFSMSMVIRVKARGVYADGSSHYLTALDEDGGVRGIAQAVAFLDEWRYLLTIYSESEGDRMSFRFYDATNSLNIPIADTVTFVNNSVIGTASMPYDLEANFLDVDLDQSGQVSISRVEQSWSGSESIIFSITDNGTQNSYSSSDEAIYTVEGDYEPILSGIPDESIGPDGTFSLINLDSYLETFDDDEILWSVSGNVELNVSIDGSTVTITHDADYIGSETLVFTATDDNETGFSSSDTATYSVVAYDNVPLLFNVPDQTIALGAAFDTLDLSAYLTELDGDNVIWDYEFLDYPSTVSTPDWEAPLSGTYTMAVVSTVEALGVVAEGSDHILIAVDENYDILGLSNALNVSDTWIYNMTLYSDENNIDYKFVFYDNASQRILPVDAELEFVAGNVIGSASEPIELNAGRVFISVDGQGKVSFDILADDWDLAETVRFTVTDAFTDENKSSYNDISIMIENDLPELSISSWTTQEGGSFEPFELADYISDNGTPFDSLLVSVSTGPNYAAEIVDDVLIVYSPSDIDWHGSELVSFEITDAHPYNVKTLEADIEFIITPVNDAPIIADKSDEFIDEDVPTTFAMMLTDIDTGEVLTLSAFSGVSELSVTTNSEDSTITVIPEADWYGESEVVVIVSDGELTDTTSFLLTVSPVNDAPRLSEISDKIISEDDTLTVALEVVNVDTGETLTAFASSSSDRVSITANSDDLIVEAVPDLDWHGQAEIDVIVSDGQFAQAISFLLIVNPVNDAPVIEQVDDLFVDENSPLVVDLNFYDVDSEFLTITSSSDRDEVTTVASVSSSSIEIFTSDFHGPSEITVIVSDEELSDTTNFIVTILPTNDAPIIAPVDNISIEENSEITVQLELTDIDTGEVLTVLAYSDTIDVIVTPNSVEGLYDSTITISTTDDWHGFSLITVIVSDGELTDTTQFSVAVGPVNDAPIIMVIDDQVLQEDSVGVFTFEVSDIDTGTVLTLTAFSDTGSVSVITNSEDYTVTVTPNQDWHGQAEITVVVSDNFLTDTTAFTFKMTPVNDAPIIAEKSDQVIDEDVPETFTMELTDVDTGEVLTLSVFSSLSDLAVSANSDDSTITVTPAADWYGESEVVVIVSDGELSDTTSFMVIIDPVNDAPRLADILDQTMWEDDTLVVHLEVVNVDTGETLTAFVSSSLDNVIITANSDDLTIEAIPQLNWHGQTEVNVIVSDGLLAQSVSFLLTIDPVNDAPTIIAEEIHTMFEDSVSTFSVVVADVDTGTVFTLATFSDTGSVSVAANSENYTVTATPVGDWYGQSNITVIVSDNFLTDTTSFTLVVDPVNDAPIIAEKSDETIDEDVSTTFPMELTDIDTGEVLTLSAFSNVSDLAVAPNSGDSSITVTPAADWYGDSEIMVIVSDSELTDTTSFTVIVSPTNDAPIISPIENINIEENEQYVLELELTDIDTGEVLHVSAYSDTADVIIVANTFEGLYDSTLTISTTTDWYGESEVTVIVSDGGLADTAHFMVIVGPVNDPPSIVSIDDQSINEDSVGVFSFEVSDIDTGTVLTLAAYTDTSSVSVSTNSENYTVTAVPDGDWHGQTVITVILSDQQLTESTSFTLTVMPRNDAPIISDISDVMFPEDSSYSVNFQLTDIDTGEVLIFSAYSDTSQVVLSYDSTGSAISIFPEPDWNGESLISAIVSDEELSDTTTFTVTITNTPDVPFAVLQGDMQSIQDQFILVDGSASYDIDNDDLTYYWTILPVDSLFTLQGIIGDTIVTDSAYLGFQTPVRFEEHDFCIKLWVENSNGLESNTDSLMLTVQNIEANDILPDLSDVIHQVGDAIPIQVQIPAGFVVDSISLSFANSYSGFISNDMVEQSSSDLEGSSFLYEIPFYMSDYEGLAYYVYVSDSGGSTIITDTTDIILSFNDGVISSGMNYGEYAQGFPKGSWRMVSLPTYPDNSSLEKIFYAGMGASSESTWMIYGWNNIDGDDESGIAVGWVQPAALEPGKAYWLKQIIVNEGYFSAPSGETAELTGYNINVDPGWNMISSPYVFPVTVDIDRNIFSELYVYGSGSLEGWIDTVVSVMSPWAGYAVYNHDEITRNIELRPLAPESRQLVRVSDQTKWKLEIDVRSGNYIDGKNAFGVSLGATDGKDNLDSPEPPVFDKYLSLYSLLKNAKGKKQKITNDFRGVSDSLHVWDLILDSKVDQDVATMNLSMMGDIGTSVVWFIDMQNGQAHDLSQTGISTFSIELGPDQLSNRYKMVYGEADEAGAFMRKIVAMIPREFSLGNNYPNPFNPSTTIPFTISKPGLAVIDIYDLNGRHVRRVVNEHLGTGYYSRIWDGKNSQGVPVSSGVYYYGLQTKSFNSYKKMILIK